MHVFFCYRWVGEDSSSSTSRALGLQHTCLHGRCQLTLYPKLLKLMFTSQAHVPGQAHLPCQRLFGCLQVRHHPIIWQPMNSMVKFTTLLITAPTSTHCVLLCGICTAAETTAVPLQLLLDCWQPSSSEQAENHRSPRQDSVTISMPATTPHNHSGSNRTE